MIDTSVFEKEGATFREILAPAMEITDPEDARAWLEGYIAMVMRLRPCEREEAERVVKENLGYWTGYYSVAVQKRIEELFGAVHPIFGSVHGPQKTPEQIMEMGRRLAEERKE